MEVISLRNYEILNENPRIIYAEGDYINAPSDWDKNYGYVKETEKETICIFSADREERLKKLFKESMIKDLIKKYKVINFWKK